MATEEKNVTKKVLTIALPILAFVGIIIRLAIKANVVMKAGEEGVDPETIAVATVIGIGSLLLAGLITWLTRKKPN